MQIEMPRLEIIAIIFYQIYFFYLASSELLYGLWPGLISLESKKHGGDLPRMMQVINYDDILFLCLTFNASGDRQNLDQSASCFLQTCEVFNIR